MLARHVDSRETRLAENPEVQSELDPRCWRLRDVQALAWLFIHLGLGRGLKDKGTWTNAALGVAVLLRLTGQLGGDNALALLCIHMPSRSPLKGHTGCICVEGSILLKKEPGPPLPWGS